MAEEVGALAPPPGVTVTVTFSEAVTVTVAGPQPAAPVGTSLTPTEVTASGVP